MSELLSNEAKTNKHIWKYFWFLFYDGPYLSDILDKLAPPNGILENYNKNINSFLQEKQIEGFYDTVFHCSKYGRAKIVTHNFLDWYVSYCQNYIILNRDIELECLLPCKIPAVAVPKLTFNFGE